MNINLCSQLAVDFIQHFNNIVERDALMSYD
jgi:hypothetical protein